VADAGTSDGRIDPEFTAYPLRALADTALQRATELGAQHADFRAERILAQEIVLSDGAPETLDDSDVLPRRPGPPRKRCRSRGLHLQLIQKELSSLTSPRTAT